VICRNPEATVDAIACWTRIDITGRPDAPRAPAPAPAPVPAPASPGAATETLQRAVPDATGEPGEALLGFHRALAPEIRISTEPMRKRPLLLTVAAMPGHIYELDSSADLAHWTMLDRRCAATSPYQVADTQGPDAAPRFYRIAWTGTPRGRAP
jgi:hypothetical protein